MVGLCMHVIWSLHCKFGRGGGNDIPCHSGLTGWFLTGGRALAARYHVVGAHERHSVLYAVAGSTSVSGQILVSSCDLGVDEHCFYIFLSGYGKLLNAEGKPYAILRTFVFFRSVSLMQDRISIFKRLTWMLQTVLE